MTAPRSKTKVTMTKAFQNILGFRVRSSAAADRRGCSSKHRPGRRATYSYLYVLLVVRELRACTTGYKSHSRRPWHHVLSALRTAAFQQPEMRLSIFGLRGAEDRPA